MKRWEKKVHSSYSSQKDKQTRQRINEQLQRVSHIDGPYPDTFDDALSSGNVA